VDGDGYVSAECCRRSIFPCVELCWSFVQKKLGFLIDFIVRYVEGLAPHGVSVYVRKGGKGRIASLSASGREALLSRGLARWSWKVSWCAAKAEKLRREIADLRSKFYTTPEVARRLHVSRDTVLWWCNHGSVRFIRIRGNRYGPGSRYRFIIPVEEVERLEAKLVESEKRKRGMSVSGTFLSVKEASSVLGVSRERVWQLCKSGRLKFAPVHSVGGKKRYLIPVEEAERLKCELGKSKDC
jgi:excisionase family DNA binding protein